MRPILQACRAAPSVEGFGPLVLLMIVVNVEFFVLVDFLLQGPVWTLSTGYPVHVLLLLGGLGAAVLLWTTAFTRGWVCAGTGAGFRVASLGLVLVLLGRFVVVALGFESRGRFVYDEVPSIAGVVWVARNLGLAAYAYGLVFVALSCWADRRLRRTAPR